MRLVSVLSCVMAADRVVLLSFHGGNDPGQVNNLYKYDFVDNPNAFVWLGPLIENENDLKLRSPRGMLYNKEEDYLLHLNAYKGDSKIVKTSPVRTGSGMGTIFTALNLLHPYGIAMHPEDPHVYVSNQGTGDITRYTLDGLPTQDPVFVHIEDPRAIAFDQHSNLWVCDKNTTSVKKINANGTVTKSLTIVNPIGLAIHEDLVFVSSDNGPDDSVVFAFHTSTYALIKTFRGPTGSIHHPCGLVIDGPTDSLYVMSQSARQIVRFNLSTSTYVGPVLTELGDVPEHIIIVPNTSPAPTAAPTPSPPSPLPTLAPSTPSAPSSVAPSSPAPSAPSPPSSTSPSAHTHSPTTAAPSEEQQHLLIALIFSGATILLVAVAGIIYFRTRKRKPHALLAHEEQFGVN